MRVRASFSPEILQAGAVQGLSVTAVLTVASSIVFLTHHCCRTPERPRGGTDSCWSLSYPIPLTITHETPILNLIPVKACKEQVRKRLNLNLTSSSLLVAQTCYEKANSFKTESEKFQTLKKRE